MNQYLFHGMFSSQGLSPQYSCFRTTAQIYIDEHQLAQLWELCLRQAMTDIRSTVTCRAPLSLLIPLTISRAKQYLDLLKVCWGIDEYNMLWIDNSTIYIDSCGFWRARERKF